MRYDFKKNEKKWKEEWGKSGVYEPDLPAAKKPLNKTRGKPFYNLMMFPYPSAEGLHVGNMYAFVGADIYGRFQRMQGNDVFEPIGLDGFGIHSENYAIKIGAHPAELAKKSEKHFYGQLERIGNGFAWNERLETYDPEYYKWTQWIFAEMFRRGLAYRKKAEVNWCPSCKTVLADEQVLPSGECERCATQVIRKELEQWFFRITDYAERLLNDLEKIDWSERIKIAQKNWIGKSEGANIKFSIINDQFSKKGESEKVKTVVEVFTTRPDTLFGATYLVLSPEHTLLSSKFKNQNAKLQIKMQNWEEVDKYIQKAKTKTAEERISRDHEKTGVELEGVKAINPATKEEIPIWVADYVLAGYGTGAIMAVPAHDERDMDFARTFGLPVRQVVRPVFGAENKRDGAVHRETISAIVRRPSDGKVLILQWKEHDWVVPVIGGIDEGEDAAAAAEREVLEETGYRARAVYTSPVAIDSHFYAAHKKEWRSRLDHAVLLEVTEEEHGAMDGEEEGKYDIVWMEPEEAMRAVSFHNNKLALHLALSRGAYTKEWEDARDALVNSGEFDGMDADEAKQKITERVGGKTQTQYRLRDWLISRQRYWGPPIPLIFCENCKKLAEIFKSQFPNPPPSPRLRRAGKQIPNARLQFSKGELENPGWIAVPEEDLPVLLPDVKDFRPTGTDKSPLATVKDFVRTQCPKCGGEARRETDVSDTFLDSAWYYLRYPSVRMQNSKIKMQNYNIKSKTTEIPWNHEITKRWLPVDMYIGGAEHAVLHLLYTRFLTKVFHDWGLVDFDEPFKTFRAHGLLIKDGAKMSKSKGNVVNPDEYIEAWGADTMRMYLMFLGPFAQGGDFRDSGIVGAARFLKRVWEFVNEKIKTKNAALQKAKKAPEEVTRILHQSIKKITDDISGLRYNTAIAQLMILLNAFEKDRTEVGKEELRVFLKLLAPLAPFLAEELWHVCGAPASESIHTQPWPVYEVAAAQAITQTIVVQINGKLRDTITLPADADAKTQKAAALASKKVREALAGRTPERLIAVPGRLVNIVV